MYYETEATGGERGEGSEGHEAPAPPLDGGAHGCLLSRNPLHGHGARRCARIAGLTVRALGENR